MSECPTLRGLNILGHAQLQELDLGSECGGHGVCGKDRVRIDEKERHLFSPPTEVEKSHLSTQELEAGVRLACQCYPRADGENCKVTILKTSG